MNKKEQTFSCCENIFLYNGSAGYTLSDNGYREDESVAKRTLSA